MSVCVVVVVLVTVLSLLSLLWEISEIVKEAENVEGSSHAWSQQSLEKTFTLVGVKCRIKFSNHQNLPKKNLTLQNDKHDYFFVLILS